MIRLLPILLILAWATPARAGEPCRSAVVIRDGKAFLPETVRAPGFDAKTSPTAPWCDGDLLPTSEVLRLLLVEDAAELARDQLVNEQDLRAIDRDEARELLEVERNARRACETQHAPPPPRPRPFYQSPWFGASVGVVVGAGLVLGAVFALGAGE